MSARTMNRFSKFLNAVILMKLNKNIVGKYRLTLPRRFCTTGYERLDKLLLADETDCADEICNTNGKTDTAKHRRARSIKVVQYFTNKPHLNDVKAHIPSKYFLPKRRLTVQHLYLVDRQIAASVVSHMWTSVQRNKEQLVCETNAGLGLISAELLKKGIKLVRLYETCGDFRRLLKIFNSVYPNQVELFARDIFHLRSLSNMDKYDGGDRVQQLLKGVPKKNWTDDPVMTIVGPMPNMIFIHYLIKMLTLQKEIVTHGRIQIFALMKPMDYIKATAKPGANLHVYQTTSILFQLFFEYRLLDKYPRKSFLPWETKARDSSRLHAHSRVDMDYIYLVRINLKKTFPTETQDLLHLYYFIVQAFRKGKSKVIPTLEKWFPGIGANLIAPRADRKSKSFPKMNIYTEFGEASPEQILQIFLEVLEHPGYKNSPFAALVEAQLLKNETIESDLANTQVAHHTENLQEYIS